MMKTKLSLLIALTCGLGASAQAYSVKAGDTLYGVARVNGLSTVQLASMNGLAANATLRVGQQLRISGTAVARSSSPSSAIYTVRAGDSLSSVARSSGLGVSQLASMNGLAANATLQVGQRLRVTGSAQATATRSPAAVQAERAQSTLNSHGRVRAVSNRYVGIRYRLGGTGRGGIDCSAFTSSVLRDLGVRVPRTSRAQYGVGRYVTRATLREGDLVFFNTLGRGVSHVGIYLGGGMMANANSYQGRVVVESMNTAYWSPRFLGARRVMG